MKNYIVIIDYCDNVETIKLSFKSRNKDNQSIQIAKQCGDDPTSPMPSRTYKVDALAFSQFLYDLKYSPCLRRALITFLTTLPETLCIRLQPPKWEIIDHAWDKRIYTLVTQCAEADYVMSWLSTLGGAYSSLGDEFKNCAKIAGQISQAQMSLAMRFGDPLLVARCRLFQCISLIQCGKMREGLPLFRQQYNFAKTVAEIDPRLLRMCQGIYMKIQYYQSQAKQRRIDAGSRSK